MAYFADYSSVSLSSTFSLTPTGSGVCKSLDEWLTESLYKTKDIIIGLFALLLLVYQLCGSLSVYVFGALLLRPVSASYFVCR